MNTKGKLAAGRHFDRGRERHGALRAGRQNAAHLSDRGNRRNRPRRLMFGESGTHARSAFGAPQLPFGSCVEIDLIAEAREG